VLQAVAAAVAVDLEEEEVGLQRSLEPIP